MSIELVMPSNHLILCHPQETLWLRIHLSMQETQVRSLGQEDPLEEEMETHSSILAWEIPWTEKLDGLQLVVTTHTHSCLMVDGKALFEEILTISQQWWRYSCICP